MNYSVSVIIPIYNVEKYVERCLRSLLEQTYCHSEIECILVDDCSPDRSMEIVKRIIDSYQGAMTFVLLRHEENQGLSEARNTGIRHARGKFFFFMDSDDYITVDCIERHMKELENHPDLEVVLANFYHDKPGGGLSVKVDRIPHLMDHHSQIFSLYLRDILPMTAWNVLIRQDIIKKNDLTFGKRLLQEDILWSFHLYRCTSRMAFCPDVTYWYCDNEDSIMNVKQSYTPMVISYCRMLSDICNYIDKTYYIDIVLFCERMLWRGIDYASENDFNYQHYKDLKAIRNYLFKKTISDGRLVLAVSLMFLYKPLSYIKGLRLFRRYYDHQIECIRKVAFFFNFLH